MSKDVLSLGVATAGRSGKAWLSAPASAALACDARGTNPTPAVCEASNMFLLTSGHYASVQKGRWNTQFGGQLNASKRDIDKQLQLCTTQQLQCQSEVNVLGAHERAIQEMHISTFRDGNMDKSRSPKRSGPLSSADL